MDCTISPMFRELPLDITRSPEPRILFPFIVFMLVPLTRVSCALISSAVCGTVILQVTLLLALAVKVLTVVPFFCIVNIALFTVGIIGLFNKSA